MASAAQFAANRANAQKSTGPDTPEAKGNSRLNAIRAGLTGQITTMSDSDRHAFEKLTAELIPDLEPKTVMEIELAHAIAWDTWRLDRLRATETNMYALGAQDLSDDVEFLHPEVHAALSDALTFSKQAKQFDLMSLYEQRMNRSIHKNLTALQAMQATRKVEYERERDEEILLARLNEIKGLPDQARAVSARVRFVFSNDEIVAAALRQRTLEEARQAIQIGRAHV